MSRSAQYLLDLTSILVESGPEDLRPAAVRGNCQCVCGVEVIDRPPWFCRILSIDVLVRRQALMNASAADLRRWVM